MRRLLGVLTALAAVAVLTGYGGATDGDVDEQADAEHREEPADRRRPEDEGDDGGTRVGRRCRHIR